MAELCAVLAIADYKRPNPARLPSRSYLAFVAGMDESEFESVLAGLQAKGYIRVEGTPEQLDITLNGLLDAIDRETRESYATRTPSAA